MYNWCRTILVRRRRKSINIENAIINIAGKASVCVCVSPFLCTWYCARRTVVKFRKETWHTHGEKASDKIATRIYSVKGLFLVKNVEIILNIIYHHCVDRGKKTLFLVNGLLCAWHIKWKKAIEPIKLKSRNTIHKPCRHVTCLLCKFKRNLINVH